MTKINWGIQESVIIRAALSAVCCWLLLANLSLAVTPEELEKIVKDRARLLSQTDNIALLRSGQLEIVRVGRANLAEQSWWRYGRELAKRRKNYKTLSTAGAIGAGENMQLSCGQLKVGDIQQEAGLVLLFKCLYADHACDLLCNVRKAIFTISAMVRRTRPN